MGNLWKICAPNFTMSDARLEEEQRERLIACIRQASQILAGERFPELTDNSGVCQIVALSLKAATLMHPDDPGDQNLFLCGNDSAAKREVANRLCEWFGWKPGNIIDLGDITDARGTKMFLALWVR